jgi:hypothetical protein
MYRLHETAYCGAVCMRLGSSRVELEQVCCRYAQMQCGCNDIKKKNRV